MKIGVLFKNGVKETFDVTEWSITTNKTGEINEVSWTTTLPLHSKRGENLPMHLDLDSVAAIWRVGGV